MKINFHPFSIYGFNDSGECNVLDTTSKTCENSRKKKQVLSPMVNVRANFFDGVLTKRITNKDFSIKTADGDYNDLIGCDVTLNMYYRNGASTFSGERYRRPVESVKPGTQFRKRKGLSLNRTQPITIKAPCLNVDGFDRNLRFDEAPVSVVPYGQNKISSQLGLKHLSVSQITSKYHWQDYDKFYTESEIASMKLGGKNGKGKELGDRVPEVQTEIIITNARGVVLGRIEKRGRGLSQIEEIDNPSAEYYTGCSLNSGLVQEALGGMASVFLLKDKSMIDRFIAQVTDYVKPLITEEDKALFDKLFPYAESPVLFVDGVKSKEGGKKVGGFMTDFSGKMIRLAEISATVISGAPWSCEIQAFYMNDDKTPILGEPFLLQGCSFGNQGFKLSKIRSNKATFTVEPLKSADGKILVPSASAYKDGCTPHRECYLNDSDGARISKFLTINGLPKNTNPSGRGGGSKTGGSRSDNKLQVDCIPGDFIAKKISSPDAGKSDVVFSSDFNSRINRIMLVETHDGHKFNSEKVKVYEMVSKTLNKFYAMHDIDWPETEEYDEDVRNTFDSYANYVAHTSLDLLCDTLKGKVINQMLISFGKDDDDVIDANISVEVEAETVEAETVEAEEISS
jgi:hypothetical protein